MLVRADIISERDPWRSPAARFFPNMIAARTRFDAGGMQDTQASIVAVQRLRLHLRPLGWRGGSHNIEKDKATCRPGRRWHMRSASLSGTQRLLPMAA